MKGSISLADNLPNIPIKKVEFLTFIIAICAITAVIVLVVDFQIKGAILDATNRYYKFRSNENDRAGKAGLGFPDSSYSGNDGRVPGHMVDSGTAGVETPSDTEKSSPEKGSRKRSVRGTNTEVPKSDKPVGT